LWQVKFFERVKLERSIRQLQRALAAAQGDAAAAPASASEASPLRACGTWRPPQSQLRGAELSLARKAKY
jgi:hypothetical protein